MANMRYKLVRVEGGGDLEAFHQAFWQPLKPLLLALHDYYYNNNNPGGENVTEGIEHARNHLHADAR